MENFMVRLKKVCCCYPVPNDQLPVGKRANPQPVSGDLAGRLETE